MCAFHFNSSSCLSEHITCHAWVVNPSTLREDLGRKWKQLVQKSQLKGKVECFGGSLLYAHSVRSKNFKNNLLVPKTYWKLFSSTKEMLSLFFWTCVECSHDCILCLLCGFCGWDGIQGRSSEVSGSFLWTHSGLPSLDLNCTSAEASISYFSLPSFLRFRYSYTFLTLVHRESRWGEPNQWDISS